MKHSVIRSEVTETLKLIALLHNLSIKQADGAMSYLGIMLIMRHHDDGGALAIQKTSIAFGVAKAKIDQEPGSIIKKYLFTRK